MVMENFDENIKNVGYLRSASPLLLQPLLRKNLLLDVRGQSSQELWVNLLHLGERF